MFRTRPPWFALACVGLWLLQLGLTVVAFRRAGAPVPDPWWLKGAVLLVNACLGLMLLVQLPRALQWRPRRSARPTAEVLAERRRIARDLHDHLGSQLVCAIALLNPADRPRDELQLQRLLEKCLLDLRLIVDSMDSAQAPFPDRLAQLRYRVEPVLASRGIRMLWDVRITHCVQLSQRDACAHVIAIVQEALSNALQHSNASEISVTAEDAVQPGALCVEVSDNGCSAVPPDTAEGLRPTGKGVSGMAHRARLAGGALSISRNAPSGTRVRIVVPCASPVASQSVA